ncbi:MAG: hypothetical protein U9O64_03555 [Campylobacterota bacterium]|nr:hypothetical protein [Campylobacterota bacterium]
MKFKNFLLNFKKYVFSKFIDTLLIEDSFFFKVKFDKKVKLTDELIALNYKKNAPYKNPFFIALMEEKNLYIWFYEKKFHTKVIIPEAYLLFDFFKENNPNTLLSIDCDGSFLIIIIKEKMLENSYSLLALDENLIAMEMNKYALTVFKKIDKKEYLQSKEKAVGNIGPQELYKWNSLKIDHTDILPKVVNSVAYPFAFLLTFIMSVQLYHVNEVEKRLESVEARYLEIKSKNDEIRERINHEDAKEQKWIEFAHRELPYVDSGEMFMRISKAFNKEDVIFKSFSILGSRVKIDLETKKDFIIGVKILNQVEGLKNVVLKKSNKKRKTASYEATLKKGLSL